MNLCGEAKPEDVKVAKQINGKMEFDKIMKAKHFLFFVASSTVGYQYHTSTIPQVSVPYLFGNITNCA